MVKNLVRVTRGQLGNLIGFESKFEFKFAMSTFSEIWFYTKLSTNALTNVLRILTIEAPVAHQSARHSQRRSVDLTCSSSQKPTIVHARFVQHNLAARSRRSYPLSPCRERQAERASHEQRSSNEGTKLFCAAALVGAVPSKYVLELHSSHETINKRR